jgi:hypothetical protein
LLVVAVAVVVVVEVVLVVVEVVAVVLVVVELILVGMVPHQGAARLFAVADTPFLTQDLVGRVDKVGGIQGSQSVPLMEEMDTVCSEALAEGSLDWVGDGLMGERAGKDNK